MNLYSNTQTQQELYLPNIFDSLERQNIFISQINIYNQINLINSTNLTDPINQINLIKYVENIFKLANISNDFLTEIAIKLNNTILFDCIVNKMCLNKKFIQIDSQILNLILEYSNLHFFTRLHTENLFNFNPIVLFEKIIDFGSETILEFVIDDTKIINLNLFVKILNSRYKYSNKFLERIMKKIYWTNVSNSADFVNLLVRKNLFNLILVAEELNLIFNEHTLITSLEYSNSIVIGWLLNKNIRLSNEYFWNYSQNQNITSGDEIIQLLKCFQYKIRHNEQNNLCEIIPIN